MNKIMFCFLCLLTSWIYANETVTITTSEWAPFTSETNKDGQLAQEVVIAAFESVGIDVVYKYYPWKRGMVKATTGEVDAAFPWSNTVERAKIFHINTIPVIINDSVFFHLKSLDFNWNTLEDLKKYRVGVVLGYKQEKIYSDLDIKYKAVQKELSIYKNILSGRIDVFWTSKIVGLQMIKDNFSNIEAEKFTYHSKPVEENRLFVLFNQSPRGKILQEKFDIGMKNIIDNGTYNKIMAKI